MIDVISLAQELIRCPSMTPEEAGALDIVQQVLSDLGFSCHRLVFQGVHNLYARRGKVTPHLCFLGHTDVVPIGTKSAWTHDPFGGILTQEGLLYGRGAVDMKGALAAFITALSYMLSDQEKSGRWGSLSLLITGDEEGEALHGTRAVLPWLHEKNEKIDFCLVGEPSSQNFIGDTLRIGRRGSLSGVLTVLGTQGHVAYPDAFDNPIPRLVKTIQRLYQTVFDEGSEHFPPTHLEVTSIDVENAVFNMVPQKAQARFNIRFNDAHSSMSLQKRLRQLFEEEAGAHQITFLEGSEAFLTSSLEFAEQVRKKVQQVTGRSVRFSTGGGTSDARFMQSICPVVELGLKHQTAHQANEHVSQQDLKDLTALYIQILTK